MKLEPYSTFKFWRKYAFDKLSNQLFEISYFNYIASKFTHRHRKDEIAHQVGDEGLDGIKLVNGQLMANGKSIVDLLEAEDIVQVIDGRV